MVEEYKGSIKLVKLLYGNNVIWQNCFFSFDKSELLIVAGFAGVEVTLEL